MNNPWKAIREVYNKIFATDNNQFKAVVYLVLSFCANIFQ